MNRPAPLQSNSSVDPSRVRVFETPAQMAEAVAERVLTLINQRPAAVLGLATGGTPKPVYDALVKAYRNGRVDFSKTTTFNLDEYIGLRYDHPDSFAAYMDRELFSEANFDREKNHLLRGEAADPEKEAADYEAAIVAAGGIDLQLLGIGSNGHIGFNEPGSPFESRTRVITLSRSTLEANLPSMEALSSVPESAITMGIASIMDAREIIVMATGEHKAEAVANALLKAPDRTCPASGLASHPNVTWFLDRKAAILL